MKGWVLLLLMHLIHVARQALSRHAASTQFSNLTTEEGRHESVLLCRPPSSLLYSCHVSLTQVTFAAFSLASAVRSSHHYSHLAENLFLPPSSLFYKMGLTQNCNTGGGGRRRSGESFKVSW